MELIFEIGCEELPARFVEPALDQMKTLFEQGCLDARIDSGQPRVVGTPRRLTLLVEELADRQSDLEEERTGPPAKIAIDDEGEPTRAAEGFARGQGVGVDDLYTVETEKGEYLAARVFEKGESTTTILPQLLQGIIDNLSFPKSMRWETHRATFGRPVRWLLAVADGDVVAVEFNGTTSSKTTYGHRFAAPDPIDVASIDDYLDGLIQADVVVDPDARRDTIEEEIHRLAQHFGGTVVEDPALVDEVTQLVEKPFAVGVEFSEAYLELPREVLISSMRSHQRYFAIEDRDGQTLKNACVVIYNTPVEDPKIVAQGNLKVLRARLDDARFFWERDLEVPLEKQSEKLRDVIWIGPLGTMHDRSQRIAELAAMLAEGIGLDTMAAEQASRAGVLSKADLVTQMVHEFPDLQGVMGREYALKSGESLQVARAIEEQYLPASADGALPQTPVGACLAVAEKLDAIVGCFGVDMKPTSTSDPYGLRRAAVGVLRIVMDRQFRIPLGELVALARATYTTEAGETPFANDQAVDDEVLEFFVGRLRHLLEENFPTDVVNSVVAAGITDIPSAYARCEALFELRDQAGFEPLAHGFKRIVNILSKEAEQDLQTLSTDPSLFETSWERDLYQAFQSARDAIEHCVEELRWDEACQTLIELKEPVDQFFDHVMVMADDEALRTNRIALLFELRSLFFRIADISRMQA